MPFDIFRARDLSLANGVALLGIATASLVALVLTIYVQEVMRYSPLLTGLVFLPAGASGILGGLLAARAVGRQGLRAAAVAGPLILAAGCLLLTGIAADGSLGTVVVGYIVAGVGIVAAAVTSTIAGTAGVEPHSQGLASGVLNTSQQVGGGIGASLASVILGAAAFSYAESAAVSLTGGGQVGLLVGLGLSLVAAALALCIDGGRSILEPVAGR